MATRNRTQASLPGHSRPASRASTTSATSQHDTLSTFPSQSVRMPHAVGPEEQALMHYSTAMMPQQNQDFVLPPQQHVSHHHAHSAPYPIQANYYPPESQLLQQESSYSAQMRLGSVPLQGGVDSMDDKRRKGSAVTATNDKELREMLAKNEGRPLRDVAQEVIQKERTPMAEKTKQLFAMLWLRAVCKPAKTSVPRNRVYSQYANRCGTERVVPLNPASFGKLVRVIFPGIQTRRLGVRGESKYHYVDLALDDENASNNNTSSSTWNAGFSQSEHVLRRSESVSTQQIDFNSLPRLPPDTAAFPAVDGSFDYQPVRSPTDRGPSSQGRTFVYPDTRGMQPNSVESMTYPHTLRFLSGTLPTFAENEPVNLPALHPYLPPRTDSDTAEALYALYRTHCTSLIDSIRFCKEKQFFRLYTSFHGTLTVPVQKLFTHPNLAPWIEQCDLVMYRTMVRFVSRLTLQAAPPVVINILSNISANLHGHISKTFASQPPHLLEAKLRPATVFAGLLYRLIRVNQAAHAAANLLTIDQNREHMWREWATMVNPKRVMEAELPDCGYEETYKILTTEMRRLLEPLQAPPYHEDPYGMQAYSFDAESADLSAFLQGQPSANGQRSGHSQVSTENVLDRWSSFIASVPTRFPQASARTLLHCISAVGTAALRDITIMNGLSYGHWWVLKIFVDEMALWMAEMGGFLEPCPENAPRQTSRSRMFQPHMVENSRSHSGSRMSSTAPDGNSHPAATNGHGAHTQQAFYEQQSHQQRQHQAYAAAVAAAASTHPPQPSVDYHHHHINQQPQQHQHGHPYQPHPQHKHVHSQHEPDIDDSGIGMSLMDEDLTFAKLGVTGPHVGMDGMGRTDLRVEPL